jgi:hypothetical protein
LRKAPAYPAALRCQPPDGPLLMWVGAFCFGMIAGKRRDTATRRRDREPHRTPNGPAGSLRFRQLLPVDAGPRLDPGGPPLAGAWLWPSRAIQSLEPFRGSGRRGKAAVLQLCAAKGQPFSSRPVGSSSWQAPGSYCSAGSGNQRSGLPPLELMKIRFFWLPTRGVRSRFNRQSNDALRLA